MMQNSETAGPQAHSSIATPEPVPANQGSRSTATDGVTAGFVTWMCFLSVVAALLIGFFGLRAMTAHNAGWFGGSSQKIVFVDHERLYAMKIKDLMGKSGMSPEDAKADAEAFAKKIELGVKDMTDSGLLVMTTQVLLSGPGGASDVTDEVAKSMGLTK